MGLSLVLSTQPFPLDLNIGDAVASNGKCAVQAAGIRQVVWTDVGAVEA